VQHHEAEQGKACEGHGHLLQNRRQIHRDEILIVPQESEVKPIQIR
jgi:hypothetical protein